MPRASIDSASASRDSPSNALRGWSGFGRMSSTAIWRNADSPPVRPLGRIAARPRPMPRSATRRHLARELEVGLRARARGVVQRHGDAEAGRLADTDVPRDDGVEYELREMLPQLTLDVGREARAVVVHRDDHARDRQARVQL